MSLTEEQKDKVAVKALEANIWNADHYLQEFFGNHSFEDIKIAHEYLTIREGTETIEGTCPQDAVVRLAKKLGMPRYKLAQILIFMLPQEKITPIDVNAILADSSIT